MYFIMRGKPQEIVAKYHAMIGFSQMPPYYALGVFQGSKSYDSLEKVQEVVTQYKTNSWPLEGVFIENYNENPHWTYTINQETFNDLDKVVAQMHQNNQHVLFGTSYALHNSKDYNWFLRSIANKCLVDSANFMYIGEQATGILDETTV